MSNSVEQSSRITAAHLNSVADYIVNEYNRRKKDRKWLDDKMKVINRQLRMKPSVKYKMDSSGKSINEKRWMPECELPLQSQTLEVITSDVRRLLFPDSGPFFVAKAYSDDAFKANFLDNSSFIVGSETDPPSVITDDNINHFVQGFLSYALKQSQNQEAWDMIVGEATKYSVGVGRARLAAKSVFIHDSANTFNRSTKIPVLVPIPLKDVYLDDRDYEYLANGASIGGGIILKQNRRYADVVLEARRKNLDSSASNFMDGGWLIKNIEAIKPRDSGFIETIEYEGDIVFNDGTDSIFVPNVIVTVACGEDRQSLKDTSNVIRIQYNEFPMSSYIIVHYQREYIDQPYGSSPLIKGSPIQTIASEALNRFMGSAILNTEPPISYDKDDVAARSNGGFKLYPSAQWSSSGEIKIHKIGDPTALLAGYQAFLSQYSDVTGVNAPRLGAQTLSHTTASAKDQELERGTIRTVDFVRAITKGPMVKWLNYAYHMARKAIGDDVVQIYMEEYGSYVNVKQDLLPETVCFEVLGAFGPADNIAKKQQKIAAIMQVVQLNQLAVQSGLAQPLNFDAIQRELLREAGITDVDVFTTSTPEAAPAGGLQNPAIGAANPSALTVALQGLQQGV